MAFVMPRNGRWSNGRKVFRFDPDGLVYEETPVASLINALNGGMITRMTPTKTLTWALANSSGWVSNNV